VPREAYVMVTFPLRKRSRIGIAVATLCSPAYHRIPAQHSTLYTQVLIVHVCLSFPSILQTCRYFRSTTKGSTVAVRTSMGERLTAGSC
jgi:hypothetical protein